MNQEQQRPKMRDLMPKVAAMIDQRRHEWGKPHVDACITAGMGGQPDQFFACEGGQIVGTPFGHADLDQAAKMAILVGGAFMAMPAPKEVTRG